VSGTDTEEDRFAQAAYTRYVHYIPTYPFYQYSYLQDLKGLWAKTSWWGPHPLRKWERKLVLSFEYGTKAAYTSLIEYVTHALYGVEGQDTYVELQGQFSESVSLDSRVRILAQASGVLQASFPRYQAFTEVAVPLAQKGWVFNSIAGNSDVTFITISVLVDRESSEIPPDSQLLFSMDVLTKPKLKRLVLRVPVSRLSAAIVFVESHFGTVEHIFDY
jgi:hypothetical protein